MLLTDNRNNATIFSFHPEVITAFAELKKTHNCDNLVCRSSKQDGGYVGVVRHERTNELHGYLLED